MDNKVFFVPHTNWESQGSGTNLKTKEIPCLTGKGKPTAETAGAVGCWYMDTDSGTVYKCTAAADGVYTWIDLVNSDELRCIVEAYLQENPPEDGADGGHYTPVITQPAADTMKVEFLPSRAGMAAVEPVEIKLPVGSGNDSGQNVTVEPAEDDMPSVFFGGILQRNKNERVVPFCYVSETQDVAGYAKIKAQGTSSMSYPKKNQTVKLYRDEACSEKLKMDFMGWGEQNKFCFKANWIDISHARNIVSARLWAEIVKSRSDYAELPELLRTSPNQGAIDGFPIKVYADGIYQGRYTLNIPKDAWMSNMDDKLDTHCILCGEGGQSAQFKAQANIDGTDWSDEIHDTVPESVKARWNEVIAFVMNSTDDEFRTNIRGYFDLPSLIDYYLFGLAICHHDGFLKNQLYLTYDGAKWYASAYDMDSTFGLWWDGSYFVQTNHQISMASSNALYSRVNSLFHEELKARWRELRSNILTEANIVNRFERFMSICPPWVVAEDYADTTGNGEFSEIPSKDTNTIQQIRQFVRDRLPFVDNQILGIDNVVYRVQNVTLSDKAMIDTGVQLFNTAQDSTVFIDFESAVPQTSGAPLMYVSTDKADDTTTPFAFKGAGVEYSLPSRFGADFPHHTSWKHTWANLRRLAVVHTGGVPTLVKFRIADGTVHNWPIPEGLTVASGNGTLVLGCKYNHNSGVGWTYWNGTINDCRIWKCALTEAEVDGLLTAE